MPTKIHPFTGFKRDHFQFFRDLEQHNNKQWFEQNRARYEAMTGCFRGLLERLAPKMLRLHPYIETAGRTNGNFSRINRDTRFRADKSPYHTNYYLFLYDRRRDRHTDGRLYVGASGDGLSTGFSIYAAPKGALRTVFRPRLQQEQARLERWLASHVAGRRYEKYWYRSEKKHWIKTEGLPRSPADWKQLKGLVIRKMLKPSHPGLASPSVAHEIELTFERLFPLYVFTAIEGDAWRRYFAGMSAHE